MLAPRLALAALLVASLAGCSGAATPIATPTSFDLGAVSLDDTARNGVEFLSGADALAQVLAAARTARTVSFTGTYNELLPPPEGAREALPGLAVTIQWRGDADDYSAEIAAGSLVGEIRSSEAVAAARGNAAFAEVHDVAESDDWACIDSASLEQWQPLLDPIALIEQMLEPRQGSEIVVSTGAVVDDTIELAISSGAGTIGTLVVSAVGPPLPLTLVGGDATGTGHFEFSDWGTEAGLDPIASLGGCG